MTEHKMTAKEIRDKIEGVILEFEAKRISLPGAIDAIELLLKEFALQVATEAVEEETESYDRGFGKHAAEMHGESILKNIKKRLNDKNCE